MSVARVLELSAVSPDSFEAAIREAVDRATRTLRGVQSAWVKDMNVLVENNAISGFQVNLAFTFVLEEGEAMPEFEGTMGATTDEDIRRGSSADIGSASGTVREGTSTSPEIRGGGTAPGTTPAREVPPPRVEEVPSGTPPQAPPGDVQRETSPEPSPRTQEERPVRQSKRRREEIRGPGRR
jgi:dodecin